MNGRKIREDLGRIRTCIQRRDFPRAVNLLVISLKDLGNQQAPLDLRGDFRTALADICADATYKKFHSKPMVYQAGKEKDLLLFFQQFYALITGQTEEEDDYETTIQRKLNLDRCIGNGRVFVSHGKFSEADDCFGEAMKYYKDEIAAFGIIAKIMMDAGQYVRALGYVRKGLEKQPGNEDLKALGEECTRLRQSK